MEFGWYIIIFNIVFVCSFPRLYNFCAFHFDSFASFTVLCFHLVLNMSFYVDFIWIVDANRGKLKPNLVSMPVINGTAAR